MIRISTSQLYANSLNGILKEQSRISKYNLELSSGKRITSPADAPVAAAQVVNINAALGSFSTWASNAQAAQNRLGSENTQLQSVQDLIGRMRTLALQMANATVSNQDRQNGAATVKAYLSQLIGFANAQGPNGNYLFAGSRTNTQPFSFDTSGNQVTYQGDSGQRTLAVSASDSVAVSDPGNTLFMDTKNGNGTFQIAANSTNTGTATVTGDVTNPATAQNYLLGQGDSYRVSFSAVSGGGLNYQIERGQGAVGSSGWNSSATTVASGSYSVGSNLSFDGMSLNFSGSPAAGDKFTVAASSRQSLFETVQNLYQALNTPANTPGQNAQLVQHISNVLQSLDQAQTRLGSAQAEVGSRMQHAQASTSAAQGIQTQLKQTLSGLQDANLPSVITKLDQATLSLQAASKAFASIQGLSLFNYL